MPPSKRSTPGTVRDPQPDTNAPPEGATSPGRTREDAGQNLLAGAEKDVPTMQAPGGTESDKPATLDIAGGAPEHPEGATTPDTSGPEYSDEHVYDTPWGRRTLHPEQVDQLRRDYGDAFEIRPVTSVENPDEVINPEREARTSAELAAGEKIPDTPAERAADAGDAIYAGRDPREADATPAGRESGQEG